MQFDDQREKRKLQVILPFRTKPNLDESMKATITSEENKKDLLQVPFYQKDRRPNSTMKRNQKDSRPNSSRRGSIRYISSSDESDFSRFDESHAEETVSQQFNCEAAIFRKCTLKPLCSTCLNTCLLLCRGPFRKKDDSNCLNQPVVLNCEGEV